MSIVASQHLSYPEFRGNNRPANLNPKMNCKQIIEEALT